MATRDALLVDAFTTEPMAGNPAGVVPDATDLTDDQMAAIANELGASETAFVRETEAANFELRFFTPAAEVDLCGHATVGATAALHERGRIADGAATVSTPVGALDLEVEAGGRVWMTQTTATVEPFDADLDTVAAALGIDVAALRDVGAALPVATASTGLRWVIVPVNFLEHLGDASPDQAAIESLADDADAVGLYPFTFDTLAAESTLHARAFAPGAGVPEDPVTGTAAGACAAYLDRHAAIDVEDGIRVEQGHFLDRPGHVEARIDDDVRIGGRAVTVFDGRLVVPAAAETDIIEL